MKYKLAVVGVGSAGIQSICYFLSWLDARWEITSIHDPEINIVGIGESTNPPFLNALEHGLGFDLIDDLEKLDGTLKFGTRYSKWREHSFVNPLLSGSVAIHFNTFKLKEYAFERLEKRWGSKFKRIEGNVTHIENLPDKAVISVNGQELEYDFVIDCRGFPNLSKYPEDYHVNENAPVNHALIHNKTDLINAKHTDHIATKDGWMFVVPLTSRTSYGYMFNDKITSKEEAMKNFSNEIGVTENQLQNIEYKFTPYYCIKAFKNRVIRNGNAAVFFEPMFANSLWLYDMFNKLTLEYIASHNDIKQIKCEQEQASYNQRVIARAKEVEDMICFNYHGGSTHDTDFWRHVKKYAQEKVIRSENLKRVRPILTDMTRNKHWVDNGSNAVWIYSPLSLVKVDKNFEYNYFT